MYLSEALNGESCYIKNLHTEKELGCRMRDLGLIEGTCIKKLFKAPFGDPVAYLVRGTVLAIRNEQACKIEVIRVKENE